MAFLRVFIILIFLFCTIFSCQSFAQNQPEADSLIEKYEKGYYKDSVTILKKILEESTDPSLRLKYSKELLIIAKSKNDSPLKLTAYMQSANAYFNLGEHNKALDHFFKAVEFAQDNNDFESISKLLISIADTYSLLNDKTNSFKYYNEAIENLRKSDDSLSLGRALLNFGEEYYFEENYEEALKKYDEAERIFRLFNYEDGIPYVIGNKGMVYTALEEDEMALELLTEANSMLESLEDYYPMSVYMLDISKIFERKGQLNEAIRYAEESLKLAKLYNLKDELSEAYLKLSELYQSNKQYNLAHEAFKTHVIYRDSLTNIEIVKQTAALTTAFQVSRKQAEVDVLNQEKKTQRIIVYATIGALILIGLLAFGLYRRNNFIKRTSAIIEEERSRSDLLLKNILPSETAKELKENSRVEARRFDSVSVLFTDFAGFTLHAEHLSPEDLVSSLDFYFTEFDKLMDKHGLEKIKTLGDSYMCVGGLPFAMPDHAERVILTAIDMIKFVEESKLNNPNNLTRFDIRIGVNSGPVVAGVVGIKKFAYDIWGDTVNIASRMESNSEPGRLNISEDTYELVKDKFNCSYRGEVDVKNKGKMKMYFVEMDNVIINNPVKAKNTVRN